MVDSWNAAQLNEAVNNGSIGGGGSDLPEVSATDNGDVLTVVNGAWDKATPPSTGILDYSTTEQDTGMKWVDDRPVYQKTIALPEANYSASSWTTIEEETDVDLLIGSSIVSGHDSSGMLCYNTGFQIASGNLQIKPTNNLNMVGTSYVTILYVKAAEE